MPTIRNLHDDGHRVRFVADLDDGPVDFEVDVPAGRPVVTDAMGRLLTESGAWVLPMVEVDGEWRSRSEDPADPWRRGVQDRDVPVAIAAAVAAHLARQEAGRAGS